LVQVENDVGKPGHSGADELMLDDGAGTEDSDDNVSEISGLSDISITGAGRWHPMKGLLCVMSFIFITRCTVCTWQYRTSASEF